MLVDQRTEGVVVPLNSALDCNGKLELANSQSEPNIKSLYARSLEALFLGSLSEMAVLGVSFNSHDLDHLSHN